VFSVNEEIAGTPIWASAAFITFKELFEGLRGVTVISFPFV
jgi:hypothetical protein